MMNINNKKLINRIKTIIKRNKNKISHIRKTIKTESTVTDAIDDPEPNSGNQNRTTQTKRQKSNDNKF